MTGHRLALILTATVAMAFAVVAGARWALRRSAQEVPVPGGVIGSPYPPIPEEAHVFRLRPSDVAVPPGAVRRPLAHPRTLGMYRAVRAYPGAPPRVAHGLTEEEFRTESCNSCHERGGYVPRFRLYAPLTPHPELRGCLQCHAVDQDLVGLPLPDGEPNSVCLQCHRLDSDTPAFAGIDWIPASWPELGRRAMSGSPPQVPHRLQLRGNCLACHAGPAAVVQIRTTHPERADCRSCHVAQAEVAESVFTRPLDGAPVGTGGAAGERP